MTLVNSRVWIDLLRDRDALPTRALRRLLVIDEPIAADLMSTEVLQGVSNDRAYHNALSVLSRAGGFAVSTQAVSVRAALNCRSLRASGYTVQKTIGTLIMTRCILDRIPLLYSDRDFDPFVQHLGLIPALPADTGVYQ